MNDESMDRKGPKRFLQLSLHSRFDTGVMHSVYPMSALMTIVYILGIKLATSNVEKLSIADTVFSMTNNDPQRGRTKKLLLFDPW
jgi:hypothetical protein